VNALFVIHYPVYGGPHNQARLLAQELRRRGVSMTVLLPEGPGNAVERLKSSDIDVVTMPLHRARATLNPGPLVRLAAGLPPEIRAMRDVIRKRQIDVVQLGGLVNPHGAIAAKLENKAVIWQLLDTRPPIAVRRLLMPFVLRLSDVVMTTGRQVASVHPGTDSLGDRLLTFFPPVDPAVFAVAHVDSISAREHFGFDEGDLVIGTVGNLNPQKGHEHLLRAAARTHAGRPNTKVLIVGASHETHLPYERGLHALAERLGLVVGKDVIFSGALEDVRPALAAMDIFALSSVPRSEGAPTAVAEAMMMNLPVVAADVGAVSELVADGVTGFLVPPLDPRALSDAILRIADNPSLRTTMGARGRTEAIRLSSVDECARVHLEGYARALTHRREYARPTKRSPRVSSRR